jgi:hypothetical protein
MDDPPQPELSAGGSWPARTNDRDTRLRVVGVSVSALHPMPADIAVGAYFTFDAVLTMH